MTKLEIAKDINFKGNVFRTIAVDRKLDIKVGDEYNFFNEVESWCTKYGQFFIENDNNIEYFFRINEEIEGHEVDYFNDEECETLGCEGCDNECEVLITNDKKLIIKSISSDLDFEEMGYYEVILEIAK